MYVCMYACNYLLSVFLLQVIGQITILISKDDSILRTGHITEVCRVYVCMYVCMYGVVLYTDDVLYGTFLIYDQCTYSPENRYTNIFSLNTDEVQQ